MGARTRWKLLPNKVPSGETEPIERLFPDPASAALRDFTSTTVSAISCATHGPRHDDPAAGRSVSPSSRTERPEGASMGAASRRRAARIDFICFEPMAGDDQRHQHGAQRALTRSCDRSRRAGRGARASGSGPAGSKPGPATSTTSPMCPDCRGGPTARRLPRAPGGAFSAKLSEGKREASGHPVTVA